LGIKEEEARLTLQEHDDDDDSTLTMVIIVGTILDKHLIKTHGVNKNVKSIIRFFKTINYHLHI
jgi:hypothetical protein